MKPAGRKGEKGVAPKSEFGDLGLRGNSSAKVDQLHDDMDAIIASTDDEGYNDLSDSEKDAELDRLREEWSGVGRRVFADQDGLDGARDKFFKHFPIEGGAFDDNELDKFRDKDDNRIMWGREVRSGWSSHGLGNNGGGIAGFTSSMICDDLSRFKDDELTINPDGSVESNKPEMEAVVNDYINMDGPWLGKFANQTPQPEMDYRIETLRNIANRDKYKDSVSVTRLPNGGLKLTGK